MGKLDWKSVFDISIKKYLIFLKIKLLNNKKKIRKMADESLHTITNVQNIDYHIVTLLEKLETMRKEAPVPKKGVKKFNMHQELRTLEFWR